MKKFLFVLLITCAALKSSSQVVWTPATITSSQTALVNHTSPYPPPPSRPVHVEFNMQNDTLVVIDSFIGNCSNTLLYEFRSPTSDTLYIRKTNNGEVDYACCDRNYSFTLPDTVYYNVHEVYITHVATSTILQVNFEDVWYQIQKINSNSLNYSPHYETAITSNFDSLSGFSCKEKDLFTVEDGYIWYNHEFTAISGFQVYYQATDGINDTVNINSFDGTCRPVPTYWPIRCHSVRLIPCDSLTSTLTVNHFARRNYFFSGYAPWQQYLVSYAPASPTCDSMQSVLQYQQVALSLSTLSLSAQQHAKGVNLQWKIEPTADYTFFEILKTDSKNNFVEIATVDRMIGSTHYFYDDEKFDHSSFYKVRAHNADGHFVESNTIFEKKNETNKISVYPNPTNGRFTLQALNGDDYLVKITSLDGRIVYQKTVVHMNDMKMNLPDYSKGIYILSVQNLATNVTNFERIVLEN